MDADRQPMGRGGGARAMEGRGLGVVGVALVVGGARAVERETGRLSRQEVRAADVTFRPGRDSASPPGRTWHGVPLEGSTAKVGAK